MIIKTLWATRNGNDIPELLVAWDEYSYDNYVAGWHKECGAQLNAMSSDLNAHRFIDLEVPEDLITSTFAVPSATATVLPPSPEMRSAPEEKEERK